MKTGLAIALSIIGHIALAMGFLKPDETAKLAGGSRVEIALYAASENSVQMIEPMEISPDDQVQITPSAVSTIKPDTSVGKTLSIAPEIIRPTVSETIVAHVPALSHTPLPQPKPKPAKQKSKKPQKKCTVAKAKPALNTSKIKNPLPVTIAAPSPSKNLNPQAAPTSTTNAPPRVNSTGNGNITNYKGQIRRHIYRRFKTRGLKASRNDAQIGFTIFRDGSINMPVLRQSSGSTRLDVAALKAVRHAAPFPPLPDDFPKSFFEVTVPFNVN